MKTKNSITQLFLLMLFVISTSTLRATEGNSVATTTDNTASGVYLNAQDFWNKKLALEINCATEKHKINTHEFIAEPYIDVTHAGIKHRMYKDSIFGYRDCEGRDFRFHAKKEYQILENGNITIYEIHIPQPEGKGSKLVSQYFFSTKIDGAIKELTILNLKNAFPNNHKLHDMIDAEFKSEAEVSQYDSFHKMYKINHLLKMSN
jgi:hypothetical protein